VSSRYAAFRDVTLADRAATHDRIAGEIAETLASRRELATTYLAGRVERVEIPHDRAVTVAALIDETAELRAEAAALSAGASTDVDNGALEFPVLAEQFAADEPVMRFGADPLALAPIIRYFGMIPLLFNVFVTRAHTTQLLKNTAHLFHLDPEDVTSFKIFVHLTDVDEDCGPLHVLPADVTAKVFEVVDYKGVDRLEDEHVAELVGWDSVVRVTGPAGTVAFADTTRCLHFGGRPRAAGKPVREMVVYHYLLPTSPFFHGERGISARQFVGHLEPTGDPVWDALVGATLV
jgi:hypothetical protein